MNLQETGSQGRWLGRLSAGLAGLAVGLTAAACSPGPATAVRTASPAASTANLQVTSTLDGLTALTHRIRWQAFPQPSAEITEVDFLIEAKQLWVEHTSPYFYGDDGNYLVTSFLTPGKHVFTVRAVSARGHVATDTVTATVPVAPLPPEPLAGTWKKFVQQTAPPGSCSPGPCQPAGYWRLVISPIGWQVYYTAGGGGLYDVVYLSSGLAEIRTGMATGHQNTDGNAWCNQGAGDRPAGRHRSGSGGPSTATCCRSPRWAARQAPRGFTAFLEFNSGHHAVPRAIAGYGLGAGGPGPCSEVCSGGGYGSVSPPSDAGIRARGMLVVIVIVIGLGGALSLAHRRNHRIRDQCSTPLGKRWAAQSAGARGAAGRSRRSPDGGDRAPGTDVPSGADLIT
jgi:hypothetical protein